MFLEKTYGVCVSNYCTAPWELWVVRSTPFVYTCRSFYLISSEHYECFLNSCTRVGELSHQLKSLCKNEKETLENEKKSTVVWR